MKILMTLMGLEIGGAETHVVELCRELAARNIAVTVASNGGVYEKELEKCGIRHVKLPLNTKSPSALIKSYIGLYRLIKEERFDIVHAHARIPAFVCGLLAHRLKFRFMTSTHGVYRLGPLLSETTDWGERAVAVSCDVKQYLIDSYGFPSDNISITINGIDTERFSSSVEASRVRREFSLSDDKFRVVYVSRIDTAAALPGFLLCEAAERLSDLEKLEILTVGGGTAFEELSERARAVNAHLGREVIKLTGSRTDVAELISTADCFVGVSRAALEAMSMEKPIVLAGAQGYIGILTEDRLALAESTNFCCRGEALPTAENIEADIRELYRMGREGRDRLGKFGREVIKRDFSVARMTDDYLAAYSKMTPYRHYKRGDIIISGYYGFDNLGDDSLLTSIIAGIKKNDPDARITVLSSSPKKTAAICGVRCINRFDLPAVLREMKGARLMISGGGSLLQDGTSRKSLYYYVVIMRMAKRHGLKLMLYANGLGPLNSPHSRELASRAINGADFVSLRENASLELAREIGVERELFVTADPAFLLEPSTPEWTAHILRRESIEGKYFIVSVKDGNNFGERPRPELIETLAKDISAISAKRGLMPIFIPMHPGKDLAVTNELCRMTGCGRVISGLTASELCGLLKNAELAVGMRLHMLIFAASMGVPMLGIAYDPKIEAFIDYLGEGSCLDVRTLSSGELLSAADSLLDDTGLCERLKARSNELKLLAERDCSRVSELII